MLDMHTAQAVAIVTNAHTCGLLSIAAVASGRGWAGLPPAALLRHAEDGASSLFDMHSAASYRRDPMHGTYLD